MAPSPDGSAERNAGNEALARGAWEEARASFERALADEADDPEALEGLSWAAWWLDDAGVVFDARERAYAAYRERDDAAAAARMATWLAIDHLEFDGSLAVASGWLRRASRLLEPLAPGPEHGWLAMQEGYLARARGEVDAARAGARRSAEIGRRFAVADLEMLGLALEGSILVAEAEVEAGMRCLDEATACALEGEAEVPISGAWACCFMVSACAAVRDYGRASEWCERIAEFAERFGSRYMLAFCRAEYGSVHLWRGRWAEAEALLADAVADYEHSRPALAAGPLVELAELRRRQGRHEEAEALLEQAGPGAGVELVRARLALDRGAPIEAAELVERRLRRLSDAEICERAPGLEVEVAARLAAGDLASADAAAAELRRIATRIGTDALAAAADQAAAALALASSRAADARPLLEDAIDRLESCGARYEAARARLELALALRALGREAQAEREADAALAELEAIGAAGDAARARQRLGRAGGRSAAGAADPTPREREVLTLLAEGLSNREIAARLVISEHTVHRHVTNILRKLELPTRAAAAAHAVRAGLLEDSGHRPDHPQPG